MTDVLARRRASGRPRPGDTEVGHDRDDRLTRNANALVLSGILTSGLGFAFWVVAARVLSTDDVGTGTALVAALVLLANVSTLGLRNALPRFIPIAGPTTGRLVLRSYLVCAIVAVTLAAAFVAGVGLWADDLTLLQDDLLGGLGFAVAAAGWTIFILQDSVLTGLRRAGWVPIENLIYAVAKIGLLVFVVSTGPWALLLAWSVPAVALLPPLNGLVFRSLIPQHERDVAPAGDLVGRPFDWRSLTRFSAGEYAADVVKNVGAEGVVLVVLAVVGATQSAALFFAITITASLQLVTSNIVNAFVAEAAARPSAFDSLLRRSAVHAARLVVPAALFGALVAPLALSVFGSEYAANGTTVLRLLLLALIPQIGISLAIGVARFERRVGRVVALAFGTSVAPLAGALLLAPRYGVVAVGSAVLVGNIVLLAILVVTTFRRRLSRSAAAAVVPRAIAVRDALRHRRRVRAVGSILDELDAVHTTGDSLTPRRAIRNTNDVVVIVVDHPTNPRVIKIALSQAAAYGLHAHANALRTLHSAGEVLRLTVADVLPTLLETGTVVGHDYVIESKRPGLAPLVADHGTLAAIARSLGGLHRLTSARTTVGEALIVSLVDEPVGVLASDSRLGEHGAAFAALRSRLDRAFRGRSLLMARTHGDSWLGNVLVETDADGVTVTGIIDWEDSQAIGLPDVDLAHLWLSTQEDGIAAATLRVLEAPTFVDIVGSWAGPTPNPTLPGGPVVLLAWLAHVASGLERASRFGLGRVWLDENVRPVLDAIGDRAGSR